MKTMEASLEELLRAGKRMKSYKIDRPEITVDFSVYNVNYSKDFKIEYFSLLEEDGKKQRVHAYINMDPLRAGLDASVVRNSIPENITRLSGGNDSEEFYDVYFMNDGSGKKTSAFNIITQVLNRIDTQQGEMHSLQFPLNTKVSLKIPSNLETEREYIVPNARTDARGFPACWHVYPLNAKSMLVVEHPKFMDVYNGMIFLPPRGLK